MPLYTLSHHLGDALGLAPPATGVGSVECSRRYAFLSVGIRVVQIPAANGEGEGGVTARARVRVRAQCHPGELSGLALGLGSGLPRRTVGSDIAATLRNCAWLRVRVGSTPRAKARARAGVRVNLST